MVEPKVRDVPRRIINQKLSYSRFLSWSEIEWKEFEGNSGNEKKIKVIMQVLKPRPRTRTVENMRGVAKLEWLTTTINSKLFNWLKLNHCHLKDLEIPPKPYRIIFDEEFLFD